MSVLTPSDHGEIQAAVAGAVADGIPMEVRGHATKRGWGRPVQAEQELDLSGVRGIHLYEPEELVLSAAAGTPISEINEALAARNQHLAFEPPDWAPLYGGRAGEGTLGGVIACNLAGPRRIQAGAARDHLLGFTAVSGRGETFKSGGRVVKNVTGFDLSKLIAGSFGTLAVMSDITVKVLPAPEKVRTVLVFGLSGEDARKAMSAALNSPADVSGAAHLPAGPAARSAVDAVSGAGTGATALRIEGPEPSVIARTEGLRRLLGEYGETEELHTSNSRTLWAEIRDVHPLLPGSENLIWRVSVPPAGSYAPPPEAEHYADWGGGLVWISAPPSNDGAPPPPRAHGGHATLMRAPASVRGGVAVFEELPAGVAALSARIKESFDPERVLNPGRMYPGI